MRKCFLVALMAAAMFAVASPAASVAGSKTHFCPPGTHNSAYCECPKGTKDSRGEKGSACCVQGTPQDTANAAAAAALGEAELLTDKSKTISFSFKATVCGELHFVLQFAKQGGHGHPKTFYIDVAVASSSTTAGAVDTITVPLSLDAETILASDAAEHRTLTVSVIAVSTVGSTSATAQLNGSYAVTHGKFHHGH
jgi:hypothetical protein